MSTEDEMTRITREARAEIERAMTAWNALTEQERADAMRAAGSARPVDAMRHLGWNVPSDLASASGNLTRSKPPRR